MGEKKHNTFVCVVRGGGGGGGGGCGICIMIVPLFEMPLQSGSNDGSQHMFPQKNKRCFFQNYYQSKYQP